MRTYVYIFFLLIAVKAYSQDDTVYVNMVNPVLLVFDGKITGSVGSKDFKARPGESSIGLVSMKKDPFPSYLVVKESGKPEKYFLVVYKEVLEQSIYDYRARKSFGSQTVTNAPIVNGNIPVVSSGSTEGNESSSSESSNEDELLARKVEWVNLDNQEFYDYLDNKTTVTFRLLNVYTDQEKLFFKVSFKNEGVALDYVLSYLQIKFVDKKKVKGDAPEERKRMDILHQFPSSELTIKAGETKEMILVTEVYSGTGKSDVRIVALEEKGRRELAVTIPNKVILRAKPIGEL